MNMLDLVDRVMDRLGKRNALSLRQAVVAEANEIIRSLEQLPWCPWFLFERQEHTLVAASDTLILPTSMLRANEDYPILFWGLPENLQLVRPVWHVLERADPASVMLDTSMGDRPLVWSLDPGISFTTFRFSPQPTQDGIVVVQGYFASPVFDDIAVEHPWVTNAYRWLVNEIVAAMATGYLHNPELAQTAKAEATAENALHYRRSVELAVSQMNLVKGE